MTLGTRVSTITKSGRFSIGAQLVPDRNCQPIWIASLFDHEKLKFLETWSYGPVMSPEDVQADIEQYMIQVLQYHGLLAYEPF